MSIQIRLHLERGECRKRPSCSPEESVLGWVMAAEVPLGTLQAHDICTLPLGTASNPEESRKRLQQAADIFKKLGAKRDLEKAETKLSSK